MHPQHVNAPVRAPTLAIPRPVLLVVASQLEPSWPSLWKTMQTYKIAWAAPERVVLLKGLFVAMGPRYAGAMQRMTWRHLRATSETETQTYFMARP